DPVDPGEEQLIPAPTEEEGEYRTMSSMEKVEEMQGESLAGGNDNNNIDLLGDINEIFRNED
ncbi:hypothetical protein, partial [Ammoniphilus sp. CFH 90114]|uniref:hypothetical protein n=1 Tax=Ammoniphilus sp. CFH 90114 TaxID=2493665 RepID=UPI00196AF223